MLYTINHLYITQLIVANLLLLFVANLLYSIDLLFTIRKMEARQAGAVGAGVGGLVLLRERLAEVHRVAYNINFQQILTPEVVQALGNDIQAEM